MTTKEYAIRDMEELVAENEQLKAERSIAFAAHDMSKHRDLTAEIKANNDRIRNIAESYLLPELLERIAAPKGAEAAAYIVFNELFEQDYEAMERAVKNQELTCNTGKDGCDWIDYLELSDSPREMAVRISDRKVLTDSDKIAELFGWD